MPTPNVLRGAALLATLLALGACQTYDFEPVKPLSIGQTQTSVDVQAVANKPNFMLLVDKSGSMDQPVDGTIPACHVGGINGPLCGDPQKANPCDTTQCPTRWSELSKALDSYITQFPLIGRYGLSLFPEPETSGLCGATTAQRSALPTTSSDDDTTLQTAANSTKTELDKVSSCGQLATPGKFCTGGGTPTAASLAFLATVGALTNDKSRQQIVILFTDGLPNCSGDPVVTNRAGTLACQCTWGPAVDDCDPQIPPKGAGCLDVDQAVTAVQFLSNESIQTYVVGFGAETGTASARDTLQRIAVAGAVQFPRVCPGTPPNQPCSSDNPCDLATGLCTKQYYQANDASDLGDILKTITDPNVTVCERFLTEVPTDVSLLSVLVNGTASQPGPDTWVYVKPTETTPTSGKPGPAVVFVDGKPLCNQLKTSTGANPVNVQIRILKVL
ncbi:MAG TPA: adventurous gliding motility lipoprotein CglB [Myxococcaceae bacterium]|nr:adventurous gliding motility lipoprotein CglB [Myxococcaceae bacterium]